MNGIGRNTLYQHFIILYDVPELLTFKKKTLNTIQSSLDLSYTGGFWGEGLFY